MPQGPNAPYSSLDGNQILQRIFEEGNDIIRTDATIIGPVSATITGPIDTIIQGLATFQTSQYTVGTSAVQLTSTPLPNRSSLSIKAVISSSTDFIYIGNSPGVTTASGYPLSNGESIQLDLTTFQVIYAIGSTSSLKVCVLEIA